MRPRNQLDETDVTSSPQTAYRLFVHEHRKAHLLGERSDAARLVRSMATTGVVYTRKAGKLVAALRKRGGECKGGTLESGSEAKAMVKVGTKETMLERGWTGDLDLALFDDVYRQRPPKESSQ